MDWPKPNKELLAHADRDIAKRTQWASLVYLIVYLLIISFTPYFTDYYIQTIVLGVYFAVVSIVRTMLVIRFEKFYKVNPQNWRLVFAGTTFLMAGAWGIFCMLAVTNYNLEWTSMLVLLSTAGIASVAVTTLCIYPYVIVTFIFLILTPSVVATAFLATNESIAVMIMFLVFVAYLYFVSKRLSKEYWSALQNSFLLDKRARQLEESNRELESYSYSIAHDLRGPLRSITAFSQILVEEAHPRLKEDEKDYLNRVVNAGLFMAELIDDILELSRLTRLEIKLTAINLSSLANDCVNTLRSAEPDRKISIEIEEDLIVKGDEKLLRVVLHNLLGNAWKFTRHNSNPEIKFGLLKRGLNKVYFVTDNGVGFDMKYSKKVFGIFQRLHTRDEFEGTGIGLASVERVIKRHGGKIWVDAKPDVGANFYFTLPDIR